MFGLQNEINDLGLKLYIASLLFASAFPSLLHSSDSHRLTLDLSGVNVHRGAEVITLSDQWDAVMGKAEEESSELYLSMHMTFCTFIDFCAINASFKKYFFLVLH